MKVAWEKPLSLPRKIVYTLVLLLVVFFGGLLGVLIGGLSIVWVWRQDTLKKDTKTAKNKKYPTILILLGIVFLYAGYTVYWNIQNPSIKPKPTETPVSVSTQSVKPNYTPQDWLKAVNTVRTAHNAPKLKLDSRLNASAAEHAKDLKKYGWDSTPHYTQQRELQGYDYIYKHWPSCVGGENLVETSEPAEGIQLWLGSASHRKAMLDPTLNYAGFATSGENTVFHMCR